MDKKVQIADVPEVQREVRAGSRNGAVPVVRYRMRPFAARLVAAATESG
jgi:hypothetical protein